MKTSEKILIIRLSSIGDIVHCTAVPRSLKKRFPQSQIHWLVRSDNSEIIKSNPHITGVIEFDRKLGLRGWVQLAFKMRHEGFTHVYDAHNNLRSRILCAFLNPSHFIRRSKNRLKRFFLFWLKVNLFPTPYVSTASYVTPLQPWGVFYDDMGPEIFLSGDILESVKKLIPSPEKTIALAPATAWNKKTWPLDYWKTLTSDILEKTSYSVAILGGPKDDFCKNLVINKGRVVSLQGQVSLLGSAAAASICATLVVGDTGLLHMTEGLGKDVIGLFGPTPFGYPTRKGSQTLEKKLWCRPCSKDGSGPCYNKVYQKCMKELTPSFVMDQVMLQLEKK